MKGQNISPMISVYLKEMHNTHCEWNILTKVHVAHANNKQVTFPMYVCVLLDDLKDGWNEETLNEQNLKRWDQEAK